MNKKVISEINYNKVASEINKDNREKGFWDTERNIGELLMLITSELGEAMEAHRKGKFADLKGFIEHMNKAPEDSSALPNEFYLNVTDELTLYRKEAFEKYIKDSFEDEIADAMIRLFDLAGGLKIDLDQHIFYKLLYNKTRERLHGKKY